MESSEHTIDFRWLWCVPKTPRTLLLTGNVGGALASKVDDAAAAVGKRAIDGLSDRVGDIASKTGLTKQQVNKSIHEAKRNLPKDAVKNPDVFVDPGTGDIFPKVPGGGIGDSIGNIFGP